MSRTLCVLALCASSSHAAEPMIRQGLVVLVDCKEVPGDLRASKGLRVHGLTRDEAMVQRLRDTLFAQEATDTVSFSSYDGRSLPYIDNLVNLIIAPKATAVPEEEMVRVLVPYGRAIIGDREVVKPWPEGMDEWPHFLYDASNNAVSRDTRVGPPRHMQWVGRPLWARNHDRLASTSAVATARGRLYYIMDYGPILASEDKARWFLQAVDAFNGLTLWRLPMKSWVNHLRRFRSGPVQIARLLVAHGDTIYTTLGLNEPVVAIDGRTGKTLRTYANTKRAEEILYHQGRLIVVLNQGEVEHASPSNKDYANKAVMLVDSQSGTEVWLWPDAGFADVIPNTVTALGQQVFLQLGLDTIALDSRSGTQQWRTPTFEESDKIVKKASDPRKEKKGNKRKKEKKERKSAARRSGWTYCTLVAHQDVVLSANHQALVALSARDGARLWDAEVRSNCGQTPAQDVFVIDGVVWTSPGFAEGRDLKTGKVVKTLDLKETLSSSGHHHRCYRDRAVDRTILFGHRGIDFFDTKGEDHSRNNWIRGVCQWGIMPANGLLYAPPHDCGCYLEALLHGFWAVAPGQPSLRIPADFKGQLLAGPAFDRAADGAPSESDWPTFNHNPSRGGVSSMTLPTDMKVAWTVPVGRDITPPVIAHGTVLLACKRSKTVHALDATSGEMRWHYVAGGIVDSPPTVTDRRVLFGAADGTVTCLSLDDGALMWRFDAAPSPLKAMATGEIESLWPVKGSVLVKNDTVYFTAGRSSYLDGGLFLFGLSTGTGEVKHRHRYHIISPSSRIERTKNLESRKNGQSIADWKTFESTDKSDSFSMAGNTNDIMVADTDSVYLRHMRFNDRLEPQAEWRHHLFSTSTLLDPHEAYRSHWIYGNGNFGLVPVSYEWLTRPTRTGEQSFYGFSGSICVHDAITAWGVVRDGKHGALVALDIRGLDKRYEKNFGYGRRAKVDLGYAWKKAPSFRPRAMVKAGPTLYLAGGTSVAQLLGEAPDGILQAFDAESGKARGAAIPLRATPVFAGAAAADQALFMSLVDGFLVCLR